VSLSPNAEWTYNVKRKRDAMVWISERGWPKSAEPAL
jgi:hypothetical protein